MQLSIPPSHLALCFLQQAQAKSHLRDIGLIVALCMLAMSSPGSWLHGPGQDFVLPCLHSNGNAAMSGLALDPIDFGKEICLSVITGQGNEASLLCKGGWNLLGASAITSLEDRRLKRLKAGGFGHEGWVADCGDVAILRL